MIRHRDDGGGGGAAYIGSTTKITASSSATTISLPAGCSAGQLCVMTVVSPRPFPTGFTEVALGTAGSLGALKAAYKILTAADITAGLLNIPDSGGSPASHAFTLGVYGGATSIVLASSVILSSSSGSSVTIPGFTPNNDAIGLIGLALEGTAGAGTHDFPAAWVDRIQANQTGYISSLHDLLDIGAYNGGTVAAAGMSNDSVLAAILELRP